MGAHFEALDDGVLTLTFDFRYSKFDSTIFLFKCVSGTFQRKILFPFTVKLGKKG